MSPPITVSPSSLIESGTTLVAISGDVSTRLAALQTALDGCGGMCGNDPAGIVLSESVDKTTSALMKALTGLINATARVGDAVKACGANNGNSDNASDINSNLQCPIQFPDQTPAASVKYPSTSLGGGNEPFFTQAIESLVGILCPNGHQDRLRAAAVAWRVMAAHCTTAATELGVPASNIEDQNITEGDRIGESITSIGGWLNNTSTSCNTLATQLDKYADHLDQAHKALKDLVSNITSPSSLIGQVVDIVSGDHSSLADDVRDILSSLKSEAHAIGAIIAIEAETALKVAKEAARYADIVLYDVAALLVDAVASYGNAIQHNPLRMGIDTAVTAAGIATMIAGGGGEVGGAMLDTTGVGALLGVPVNVVSAGAIATGAGLMAGGVTDATRAAAANAVTPMAVKDPGRGPVAREPAPKSLKAFPNAQRATPKTSVQGGGGLRPRWKDPKGKIYEWDYQHKTVEVYTKNGKHIGEYDPDTGVQTKPGDPNRTVEK